MKTIASLLTLAALVLTSCSGSDSPTNVEEPKPPAFKTLTARDNILFNLEQAYEQRNQSRYDEILDINFTFFFGAQDVQGGNVPPQWDRTREISSVTNLFDPSFIPRDANGQPRPDAGPVSSIAVDLQFVPGEDEWFDTPAPDQNLYPGETWYEKTVEYSFRVTAGDLTLLNSQPFFAQFTVRPVDVGGETHYRIILWRDDILGGSASQRALDRSASATEESTWGAIKTTFE